MKEEIWKDIPGYEGKYQVSNHGRVKSLKFAKTGKPGIMKQQSNPKGYLSVSLHKNCKFKSFRVNRLVAMVFLPNPNNYLEVNHKDEDKTNNRVENLEWCNRLYNMNYGTWKERTIKNRYKKVACYTKNHELVKTYNSIKETKNDGFTPNCVTGVCRGYCKTHKGFIFEYL